MRRILLRSGMVLSAAILLFILYSIWITNHMIVSAYRVDTDFKEGIRIVQLTDLHNKEFGKGNGRLVKRVREQNPDLIVMTGDMLNKTDEDTEIAAGLAAALSDIAPLYFGYGNHEKVWERTYGAELKSVFEDAGAVVVDNSYVDVDVKGQPLRIGGYMGYYHFPYMLTTDPAQQEAESEFTDRFEKTERYKILLNHIPTPWVDWGYTDTFHVDLVFAGHYHGGNIRIPFTDSGLFAPYVGWFPKHIRGMFRGKRATCILSAGLGSEYPIPRLNNPPEIVTVDLCPASLPTDDRIINE